jgi:hypothetical protein
MTDQVQDQDVELEEEIEEAHDPKNAEEQSIASVKAAGNAGKTAPKRKGDKTGKDEPAPQGVGAKAPQQESVEIEADFSDDLNALIEGEATLSEEFKDKAATIFEAAIKSHLTSEINRLEEAYATELAEETDKIKSELVEQVDSYLNYVVENGVGVYWVAIQAGLRAEIAEGFMNGLKDLFVESYIEVPESKIDLVDDLAGQVEELDEKYNSSVEANMALTEEVAALRREVILREASIGLAETQIEKLKSLAENVKFESVEQFTAKVATLKESYFAKTHTAQDIAEENESDDEGAAQIVEGSAMEAYLAAIRKQHKS